MQDFFEQVHSERVPDGGTKPFLWFWKVPTYKNVSYKETLLIQNPSILKISNVQRDIRRGTGEYLGRKINWGLWIGTYLYIEWQPFIDPFNLPYNWDFRNETWDYFVKHLFNKAREVSKMNNKGYYDKIFWDNITFTSEAIR